jgi:hypothetical protein
MYSIDLKVLMIHDFITTRLPEKRFTSASHACGRVFQVVLTALVYEKQYHLRMMMKMHGLGDRPYWSITYLYFLALFTIYMFTCRPILWITGGIGGIHLHFILSGLGPGVATLTFTAVASDNF